MNDYPQEPEEPTVEEERDFYRREASRLARAAEVLNHAGVDWSGEAAQLGLLKTLLDGLDEYRRNGSPVAIHRSWAALEKIRLPTPALDAARTPNPETK